MEIDHIEQRADSGNDSIENAIPVCFDCHAEIHLYNDRHPRGRKFHSNEIRKHKEQWLKICEERPEIFVEPLRKSDVGPLYAIIDELKFNQEISANNSPNENGCRFETRQFDRLISEGYLSMLHDDLAAALMKAYRKMKRANTAIDGWVRADVQRYMDFWEKEMIKAIKAADNLAECYALLEGYLGISQVGTS